MMLAFDFGGSNGRAVLGKYENGSLSTELINKFPIEPVTVGRRLYWNIYQIFQEIKNTLIICKKMGITLQSIGIDTWGNSFGLLDSDGDILFYPLHYRDTLGPNCMDDAHSIVSKKEMFLKTGIIPQSWNAIYQLYGLYRIKPDIMRIAKRLLNTPDLLNYFLTGIAKNELTILSSTQCFDVPNGCLATDVLVRLGIDPALFGTLSPSGTILGHLRPEFVQEIGMDPVVIAVAGHDTPSAVAAVQKTNDFLFISCGTFSVIGVNIDTPYLTEDVFDREFTQEISASGHIQLKKNITGLWILQECKRIWQMEGSVYTYDELDELSEQARSKWVFDTTEPCFSIRCDMPSVIKKLCIELYGDAPQTPGEIFKTIEQSLAMTYAGIINDLETITSRHYNEIYMVGGGIRHKQLCRMITERTQRTVIAGPAEATVLGNLKMQMVAMKLVDSLSVANTISYKTEAPQIYQNQ